MKKFEYFTCVVDCEDLEKFLNDRGSEGWELVNAIHFAPLPGSRHRLFFKREAMVICNQSDDCHFSYCDETHGRCIRACFHRKPHARRDACKTSCFARGAKCIPYGRDEVSS